MLVAANLERELNLQHRPAVIADFDCQLFTVPVVEVHLSNITEREEWRRFSVVEHIAAARFIGKGADGYREALEFLVKERK